MDKKYLFEAAKTVAIYGVDEYSGNIYNFFNDIGKKVLFFIDDNYGKYKELDIININDLDKPAKSPDIFFIGGGKSKVRPKQIIKEKLISSGIDENLIFSSWNMWRYGYDFREDKADRDVYKDVVLEISGICNAKCPYCLHRSNRVHSLVSKKFVDPYIFQDTLNTLLEKKLIDEKSTITPFLQGEPFLHPEINNIFKIIHDKQMPFKLSTNASIMPNIETDYISRLQSITVSMSGFTQSSYDRIHGFKLKNILKNIDKLAEMVGDEKIQVHFHVYKFNLNEVKAAREYFSKKNMNFLPIVAHIGNYSNYLAYAKKTMPKSEYKNLSRDLMLYHVDDFIKFNSNFHCNIIDSVLVIDENQNYVTCCALPKNHKNYSFGNVKELSKDEVNKLKVSQDVCKECSEAGLAFWVNSVLSFDDFYVNGVFLK